MHALSRDEHLRALLVTVGVTENNFRERGATTSVMYYLLYYSANVAIALGEIEVAKLGGRFVVVGMRFEL